MRLGVHSTSFEKWHRTTSSQWRRCATNHSLFKLVLCTWGKKTAEQTFPRGGAETGAWEGRGEDHCLSSFPLSWGLQ